MAIYYSKQMTNMMKYNNFDFDALKYSEPKHNPSGGQTVFVNDSERNKIRITTPKCYLPFGLSVYNDRYSLQLSLGNEDFITFLNNFDTHNKKIAKQNSSSWFKKSFSSETIDELYNPCVKQQNPKFPPLFTTRFPTTKDGKFLPEIYDIHKNLINHEHIKPGCNVEAILELTGVYFVGSKSFGLSWKVVQLKVHQSQKITGYAFNDDTDDDQDSDAEPPI